MVPSVRENVEEKDLGPFTSWTPGQALRVKYVRPKCSQDVRQLKKYGLFGLLNPYPLLLHLFRAVLLDFFSQFSLGKVTRWILRLIKDDLALH